VYQAEEPPDFHGGIIADRMGHGKTLTMIALTATDLDRGVTDAADIDIGDDKRCVSATLVIVPPSRMSLSHVKL
jgi:SNF2 family DNA or RNA helicase